ncbi:MAG: hypothetical protein E6Q97_26735 [Desulfurellales bacterium]|nr:MAG: hypothetical protein E6Q97_26735 [Desulfurellales bacterium]
MASLEEIRAKKKELNRLLKQAERMAGKDSYANYRDRKREEFKDASVKGRDIGEIPPVKDPARRERCRLDFRAFCENYQPQTYTLPWCEDHLKVIARIEAAVIHGELFAMAMPRGSGKTSLCESAALWALAYGHRRFVACIGSDASSAEEMLASIRREFEEEDTPFAEDFPEICYPIAKKEGIQQRKLLYHGKPLTMSMTSDEIILPAIPDAPSASGILRVAGITGRIRGMKYKRKDGNAARPDLVILDDPQTDESARSPSQCLTRESIVCGAILGLAGPGKKIAGIMPCTVIRPNDLADTVLNRQKHPEWQGERTKMVYSFPTNETLWDQYKVMREEGQRTGTGTEAATLFYRANRVAMDEGGRVAWEARHNHDEDSALQHAMNLRFERGDAAFFAEYQNDPLPENVGVDELDPKLLAERCLGTERGIVPLWATRVTAFIDVQQRLLYWLVAAWGEDFRGCVIDYGTYPDQGPGVFTAQDARRTLAKALPGAGLEGSIYEGLEKTSLALLAKDWQREDGATMRIERCLIDANWGLSTDTVYEFCRRSQFASVVMPRWGKSIGATATPFDRWAKKPGERHGFKWIIQRANKRNINHVLVETNGWKSFTASRLRTPVGDKGAVTFFGRAGTDHRMLVDHLTAETCIRAEGQHGTFDEWRIKPGRTENHWWDCLCGAACAASVQGTQFAAVATAKAPKKKVSWAEQQRAAFARQGVKAG